MSTITTGGLTRNSLWIQIEPSKLEATHVPALPCDGLVKICECVCTILGECGRGWSLIIL